MPVSSWLTAVARCRAGPETPAPFFANAPAEAQIHYNDEMPKILFYLPVVTPWWFDTIVAPMIAKLGTEAEIHVLAPDFWRNTGIGPAQLQTCASLPDIRWHIVEGDGHFSLRTRPDDADGLVDFVRSINPDYVFCRSADVSTPSAFPGKVVHLMEAGASPFSTRGGWIILQRDFWHHGAMPALAEADRAAIEAQFSRLWKRFRNRMEHKGPFRDPRPKALAGMGLAEDRKIIALPLEYEHEEAFTAFHNRFERNIDLLHHVAGQLDDRFVLAVTDHPLNYRYVDNSKIYAAIEALGTKAHLVPNPEGYYYRTTLLIKHCDGLIVQNTKAIYCAAMFGKPVLRLSNRPTADWLGAHQDMRPFLDEVASGRGGVSEEQARLWFGYHIMHEIIDPAAISGAEILDRVDRPFSRDRLASGLERFEAFQRELDKAA